MRAALLHLALGFTLGALLLLRGGWALLGDAQAVALPAAWLLLPAHVEFLLVGWTVQLAMGVAFWILPRFAAPGPRSPTAPPPSRGNVAPAWAAFVLLNGGVWMVAVAPLLGDESALPTAGRLAELVAAAAFALHAWPRVKPAAA